MNKRFFSFQERCQRIFSLFNKLLYKASPATATLHSWKRRCQSSVGRRSNTHYLKLIFVHSSAWPLIDTHSGCCLCEIFKWYKTGRAEIFVKLIFTTPLFSYNLIIFWYFWCEAKRESGVAPREKDWFEIFSKHF